MCVAIVFAIVIAEAAIWSLIYNYQQNKHELELEKEKKIK